MSGKELILITIRDACELALSEQSKPRFTHEELAAAANPPGLDFYVPGQRWLVTGEIIRRLRKIAESLPVAHAAKLWEFIKELET